MELYVARLHWIIYITLNSIFTLTIVPTLKYVSTKLWLTNTSLCFKSGIIFQREISINYSKIETISVERSLLGMILGYGTLIITCTGNKVEVFENISSPKKIKNIIEQIINGEYEIPEPQEAIVYEPTFLKFEEPDDIPTTLTKLREEYKRGLNDPNYTPDDLSDIERKIKRFQDLDKNGWS